MSQPIAAPTPIAEIEARVTPTRNIPVPISYDIIKLFSEGLYQSPQKAIEELVSNSYDAHATQVHVLLPVSDPGDDGRLYVVDNGDGLDGEGFLRLWRIAESDKATAIDDARPPIGQFGIGKLASYVLAWRLTHISRGDSTIRMTSMDFKTIEGIRQNNPSSTPYELGLREISLADAQDILRDVQTRDIAAWNMLFGPQAADKCTIAVLSDFKELYSKLGAGRLKWVLRTAMPLVADFDIFVDGTQLEPAKLAGKKILELPVGGDADTIASTLSLATGADKDGAYITVPGIDGVIRGDAAVFEARLTEGKSDRWNRSNGFFVRVRGRIINIDDELFGLPALNHATWARFSMTVIADGLRDHLLSSREGVRESDPIVLLREYMLAFFNKCRTSYEKWLEEQHDGTDLGILLRDAPSAFVVEPLIEAVTRAIRGSTESYYVSRIPDVPIGEQDEWLVAFAEKVANEPVAEIQWQKTGSNDRAVRYRADTRILIVNEDHPFIAKLLEYERKTRRSATLFASSELLVDLLLQDYGIQAEVVFDLLADRDRVLRLVSGEQPATAAEVLRLLRSAQTHDTALERAVGLAFRSLGFEYERRGGNRGGPDGVLDGRLGRGRDMVDDFRLVYDAKQTNAPSVPADKIDPGSLSTFLKDESADFGFFIAIAYDAEGDASSKVNKKVLDAVGSGRPVTLLKISHLQRLVELHYQYGLTLTRLRTLFQEAHTVPEVEKWLDELAEELKELEPRVPLSLLLSKIEAAKADTLATPTIAAVRVLDDELKKFKPDRLVVTLRSVVEIVGRRFLEVDEISGEVRLHTTAAQIVAEVDRSLNDLLSGVNSADWPPVT